MSSKDVTIYSSLTINDLKLLCETRGILKSFRVKDDLINRLIEYDAQDEDSEVFDSSSSDENQQQHNNGERSHSDENGDNEENNEEYQSGEENNFHSSGNGNNDEDKQSDEGPHNKKVHHNNERDIVMATISFKDVEDALRKFSGESHEDVGEWIEEFEATADTCNWKEVQKYLFARKLLRGEAKSAVEANRKITKYEELIAHLRAEHVDDGSGADLHAKLIKRVKEPKESYIEYMYAMKKMARDKIDEKSTCKYVVAGLPDHPRDKVTLFEAMNFDELKKKLKVFAETAEQRKVMQNQHKNGNRNGGGPRNKQRNQHGKNENQKCFNCGGDGHKRDNCPDKDKGPKCFNCGMHNHVSKECRRPKRDNKPSGTKPSDTLCLEGTDKQRMRFPVSIRNKSTVSILDSGSDWSLVRETFYKKCKMGKREPSKVWMKGFASEGRYANGVVHEKLSIEGDNYDLQLHIVDDNLIPEDVLLGRDFFKKVTVIIEKGHPTILPQRNEKIEHENDIFCIEVDDEPENPERLSCVTEIQNDHNRIEVIKLIKNYKPKQLKQSHIKMELVLQDNVPVYQHPRRLSVHEREVAKEMVQSFIEQGIARPSNSAWASPILLRKKPNGTHRLCVDYRKLNQKIVKDRYPLPLMDDVLDSMVDNYCFSALDLKNGFYHVDMHEESIKYTAFVTPDGQYEFLKAPFGLCNSPAVFQRYINIIFNEAQQQGLVRLYLDDLMVAAVDEEANLKKLKKVFEIAAERGLILNFDKCKFLKRKITFLGHILENGTVKPSREKTSAVRNFPQPKNAKAIQSFLGLTGFFRKFIPKYASVAKPLSELLQKDVKFKFGDSQLCAFNELKRLLCSEPVLRLYNPKAETELHTDASALGYGGCLLQRQSDDGQLHPVHYISRKTTPAEARLHSYELETLAVITCLEKLRPYVLGIPFTIYTDCNAFQQTMSKKNAVAKIARWALALEEYNMQVKHRAGVAMKHVDALSRNFVMVIENAVFEQVKRAQQTDERCEMIRQLADKGDNTKHVVRNGVLYQFDEGYHKLVVPQSMADSIIRQMHGDTHISAMRMEQALKQDYYIQDLGKKITKIIRNCIPCILATKKRGKKDGWLQPIEKYDVPLHTYHIDHAGPMETTTKKYQYILVVIDGFSKFTWLYPVRSTKAEEAITKLKSQQAIFGNPARIIADKHSSFRGDEFEKYCADEGIERHLTTTATPRGNGQVERMNAVVKPIITKLSIEHPAKWFQHTERVQRAINAAVSRSIGTTPFNLMFGVTMKNKEDEELQKVIDKELMIQFCDDRQKQRAKAVECIAKIQSENKTQYNKSRKEPQLYTLGDLVAIERVQTVKGGKFHSQMVGPYEITRVLRHNRYEMRKVGFGDGPVNTSAPADRIKPWANDDDN